MNKQKETTISEVVKGFDWKREIELRSIIGFAIGAFEGLRYQVEPEVRKLIDSVISEITKRESQISSLPQSPRLTEWKEKPAWNKTAERPPTKEDGDELGRVLAADEEGAVVRRRNN